MSAVPMFVLLACLTPTLHPVTVTAPDLDEHTIEQLRGFAGSPDYASFFLGAGASSTVGLPDWDTLAQRLLIFSGAVLDEEAAAAFLARQDPTLAAEAARASAGAEWQAVVRSALYGSLEKPAELEPSVLHLAVAGYAASRQPQATGLFTLNFDLVLETALTGALAELDEHNAVLSRAAARPRAPLGTYEVSHLHGLVSPDPDGEPSPFILTLSDFTGIPRPAWQLSALHEALQRGPMLIAGTSLRDPDIRQWIYDLSEHDLHTPTVILARASMGLTTTQFERLREPIAAQWQAIGIHPVLVHDYADTAQAIREVTAMDAFGYRPPQRRAIELLESCFESFHAVQNAHAEQLSRDQSRLQNVLGQDANVTLWLADGEGRLVRWASPDRIYRSVEDLRRIPAGHDSPWVAGKCLAHDDFLALPASPDPDNVRRWRSVVACPVSVQIGGGPAFTSGVLSSATADLLENHDVDEWSATLTDLAIEWSTRLEQCVD